jgi:diguanylate cyclase (GGDEF)-like protein
MELSTRSALSSPILIVEDERIVAADLQSTLIEMGYDAYAVAPSGADALSRANERPPEVALMDIHIEGGMDGVETAAILRERYGTAVIFLTAYGDDATIQRAKHSDPSSYLVKPVSDAMLRSAVEIALHRQSIDAQKRCDEARLAQSNREMSTLVDQLQTAVLMEDEQRNVCYANLGFRSIFCPEDSLDKIAEKSVNDLVRRATHLIEDPEGFVARTNEIVRIHTPVTGELIHFKDGRTFERDYVPMPNGNTALAGHVWTYRDVTERMRDREALEQSAVLDELTGLHNRRGFFLAAEQYLKTARRGDQQTVLLFLDLNGLKQINDGLGHLAGDQALRDMATVLKETFRASDVLARLGGDEFVVLAMMQPQDVVSARIRLRQRLDEYNSTHNRPFRLDTSIGAVLRAPHETLDALLTRADAAMYLEKRTGARDKDSSR